MAMFEIYADGQLIYTSDNPGGSLITAPTCSVDIGVAGALDFTMLPGHPMYSTIDKMKTRVTAYFYDNEIFNGRVLSWDIDFYLNKTIHCEGNLAFLLDTLQPPRMIETTVKDYFEHIVAEHNLQVDATKQFVVGDIDLSFSGITNKFENNTYRDTRAAIDADLISEFGGLLRVRTVDGIPYLDYIKEYDTHCNQTLEFSTNILDMNESLSATEFFTVLLPTGAQTEALAGLKDGPTWPVTIESVNDGSKLLENLDGIAKYGRILHTQEFGWITDPVELKAKAQEYFDLAYTEPPITLTIKALDLHLYNADLQAFSVGAKVQVRSLPHNKDLELTVLGIKYDFEKPENTDLTIGTYLLDHGSRLTSQAGLTTTFGKAMNNTTGKFAKAEKNIKALTAIIENAHIDTAKIRDAAITNAKIGDAEIDTAKIKDAAITNAKIQNAAITSAKIQDAAITTAKIGEAQIDTANIKDAAIESAKIGLAAIKTANIDDAAITNAKIKDAAITRAKIDAAAIGTAQIEDAAITRAKIGNAAIGTANLDTAIIKTAHIQDAAITDAKVHDLSANKITTGTLDAGKASVINLDAANITVGKINGTQIANGTVDMAHLNETGVVQVIQNAQTTADGKNKIFYRTAANKPTSADKLKVDDLWFNTDAGYALNRWNGSGWVSTPYGADAISSNAITAAKIASGAINTDKLAADAVTAAKIKAGVIDATHIAANTITGNKLVIGTVGSTYIADGAITTDKINAGAVTATEIASNAITTAKIASKAITTDKIDALAVDASKIKAGAIETGHISAGARESLMLDAQERIELAVGGIQVGGRNLIKNSEATITNNTYNIANYYFGANPPANGETITISFKGTLGSGKTAFGIYNSGGMVRLTTVGNSDKDSAGFFTKTFTWTVGSSSNTYISVYTLYNSVTVNSTIQRVKLERGNKRSDWSPAPEDPASGVKTSSVEVNSNGIYMDTTGTFNVNAGVSVNIKGGSGASSIGISNNNANNYFLWAGHATPASAPFSVKMDGSVKATKIQHEMPYTFWDMADSSTPAEFPLYIPANYTVDSVTFTFKTGKARTFAKTAASGGSSTVTSAGIKEGTAAVTGMNPDVQTGDWGPATVTSSAGGTGATGGINNAPVATGGSGALTTDAAGTGVTGTPSSNSTSSNGSHTHTNTNHRHKETGTYTEYFQTAAQSAGAHTHTLGNHTHTGPSHTHGLANHSHTISTHTHNGPSHTHNLAVPKHSHLVGGHNHTVGGHSHDVTVSAHSHGLDYGINEKSALATSCVLKVGSTTIGTYSPNPSNPVEIKAYMSAGWNTVTVAPNNDARIVAFALVKVTPT